MKRILFITGTRADYGKIKTLIRKVEDSNLFEAYIFVCGMHLLKMYGSTYEEILKDSYKNTYVAFGLQPSSSMSSNLGNLIYYLNGYITSIEPDLIVVHGDRTDALAGAIVGALNNIRVAHIEGGELSGTVDESIRHAISKFAHFHFVCNNEAKKRLQQLGEQNDKIFVVGSPDIDIMLSTTLPSLSEAKTRYEISFDKYAILMFHPVTTEFNEISTQIRNIVNAVLESKKNYIVIYPNNDLGNEVIFSEYNRLQNNQRFSIYPSLRFEHFLTLLKNTEFIIGNSSVGIREACVYGVPSVDIGSRQSGRYNQNLKNIQHSGYETEEILKAIENADEKRQPEMLFGDGHSSERFFEIIANEDMWNSSIQKKFIDIEW